MTVGTRRRIRIASENPFAVNAFGKPIIGVTGCALLNHADLVPFPGRYLMDLFVAIFALDIINEVNAGIMLCAFSPVTSMARHPLRMDLSPLRL